MEEGTHYRRKNGTRVVRVVGKHESGDYLCLWGFDKGKPFRVHHYEFERDFVELTTEEITSFYNLQRMECPRRMGFPFKGEEGENLDYWEKQGGVRKCSYCGSIHPDDFISLLKEHGPKAFENSTKNYKIYLNVGTTYKYYRMHDTENFVEEVNKILKP